MEAAYNVFAYLDKNSNSPMAFLDDRIPWIDPSFPLKQIGLRQSSKGAVESSGRHEDALLVQIMPEIR